MRFFSGLAAAAAHARSVTRRMSVVSSFIQQQPCFLSIFMFVTVQIVVQQKSGEQQHIGHVVPSQMTCSPLSSFSPSLRSRVPLSSMSAADVAATGFTGVPSTAMSQLMGVGEAIHGRASIAVVRSASLR